MRRPRALFVGGLALGLAGVGLVMVYVRSVETRAAAAGETATVYVVRQAIPAGTPGRDLAGAVEATEMPRRLVPGDVVTDLATVQGLVTVGRLDEAEPLRARDFAAAGVTRGALAIPQGKEAVAVAITVDGGVGRYPQPGDRVNVYATFRDGRGVTRKILSGVEVLATQPASGSADRIGLGPAGSGQLVYLLAATPEEAARLVFGKELGSISLTLLPEGQESPPVADVTMDLPDSLERSR